VRSQLRVIVIGEATKRLSTNFRNTHPNIPWKDIAGMRDILAYQYDRVNLDTLWDVIQNNIPELIELIAPLLPKQTLTVYALSLILTKQDSTLTKCRLTFQINLEDVEGDRLSQSLIKRLVTNVTMMDEYLPGIKAVNTGTDYSPPLKKSADQSTEFLISQTVHKPDYS